MPPCAACRRGTTPPRNSRARCGRSNKCRGMAGSQCQPGGLETGSAGLAELVEFLLVYSKLAEDSVEEGRADLPSAVNWDRGGMAASSTRASSRVDMSA